MKGDYQILNHAAALVAGCCELANQKNLSYDVEVSSLRVKVAIVYR
jgi:hypothetical protein